MIIRRRKLRIELEQRTHTSNPISSAGSRDLAAFASWTGQALVADVSQEFEGCAKVMEMAVAPVQVTQERTAKRSGLRWLLLAISGRGRRLPLLILLGLCSSWVGLAAEAQTAATTFYVNTTTDAVDATPGDGICSTGAFLNGSTTPQCSLRAAVDEANKGKGTAYVIVVPAGTYNMTVTEPSCYSYDSSRSVVSLCPGNNITIKGAGASSTILDFGQLDRGFLILQGNTVAISGLTIQNATNASDNSYGGGAGGILNQGILTLSQCNLNNNVTTNNGGAGIFNTGTLVVEDCVFQNNGPETIRTSAGSTSIDLSTFANTTSGTGAIYALGGTLSIANSTFTANQTNSVLYLTAPTNIANSTLASNNTTGSVIFTQYAQLTMNNNTVTNNVVGNGFTVANFQDNTPALLSNNILSNNQTNHGGCYGSTKDLGHNLFDTGCTATDPTSKVGVTNLMLTALAIDGGTVATMTPLAGSPALNSGSSATPGSNASGACTALDANGKPRGAGATCSIGAAEQLKGLQLNNITPTAGGAGGNITMVLTGIGFDPTTTVALHRSGQTDIAPQAALVTADTATITAGFSLVGAALGSYDVIITTSTVTLTLPGGFTVAPKTPVSLQSYLSGPVQIRPGRPATFVLTYSNTGNTDAYLVPLFLGLPAGYTGTIKGVQVPPANAQQVITDYSSSSLGVIPGDGTSTVNLPLILPVVPAGSQNLLQFTIVSNGSEGDTFYVHQLLGTPYSSNSDTGVADTGAVNAAVSTAAQDDTLNLGVTPSAAAHSAMATYAGAQFSSIVAAGEVALLQTNGAEPILFSISQLLDDIGSYGAAYKSGQAGHVTFRPLYLPSPFYPPKPPNCDGRPMEPGTSCGAPFAPVPGHPPVNPCASNILIQLAASAYGGGGGGGCPPFNGPAGKIIGSVDPNLKTGPIGAGTAHYTQANTPFQYLIEFENEATASAAAQTVSVTDTLDTSTLDLSTFQLGSISFGAIPFTLNPPAGVTSFQGSIDLRPVSNIIVDVTASLNKSTGVVTWNFLSLDPATMQLTTDPTAGFLPPDTTPPAGIGHGAFTINPLSSVADASTICNTATVVFDTNSPINTAQYCNTKDVSAPTSVVQALAATQTTTTFAVTWSGTDTGSGVGSFTIYSNLDGGVFTPWLTATTATTTNFTGLAGHTYGFYSIATDLVGNVEVSKTQAEATTYVGVAAGSFSPGSIVFPATAIGKTSSIAVTIISNGAMPLSVTGFTLSNNNDFSETDNCVAASPIAVGQSCTVTVTFAPSSSASLTAAATGTLSVTSNAPAAPTNLVLAGNVDLPQSVWLAYSSSSLGRFSNSGANATQSAGTAGGGSGIAIDNAGNVWSGTIAGTSVVEFDKSGTLLGTFTGAGISSPAALAISGGGDVWIANANNTLSLLQPNGSAVSSAAGFSGLPLNAPSGLAIDASGNVWVSNAGDASLTQFLGAADPVVTPLVKAVTNSTLGVKP